jgi:hypothetical protein
MKNRIIFVSLVLCLASLQLAAQAKIRDVVTSDYNRNSVSFITIQRGDSHDSSTASAVSSFNPGEKFDINSIKTRTVRIRKDRKEPVNSTDVHDAVGATPFAREILASVFNRDAQGMMDDKTVRYRGNYDAKDQDVINARAARVGEEALGDMGYGLLKGCYIVLTDFYNIESRTNKEGKVTWHTSARAYAYRLGVDDAAINDFFERCWIYDDDSQAARDAKNSAFQNLDIPMEYVAYTVASGSGKNVQEAARSCMSGVITGLEDAIPAWEVAVGIVATKPLRAKIGTKEDLVNGARYRSYSYTEDNQGNLKSVPRGFLRATEVAYNSGISTGETEPSEFYQISGLANIEEGWTIKQSNDLRLGVAPGLRIGAPGRFAFVIDADYLMEVKTSGAMSYLLLSLGFDIQNSNYIPFSITAGYGYALHLTRIFEVMPYLQLGADCIFGSHEATSGDRDTWKNLALIVEPGARLAVNVAYPLQVYAKAYADWIPGFIQGYRYKSYNALLNNTHKTGVGVQFGLKWTF